MQLISAIRKLFTIKLAPDRVYGLDILRALAVFFVVFIHGTYILPNRVAGVLHYLSLDGVSIFFVLSGFLIGRILIQTLERDGATLRSLWHFWGRRWLRILPAYYLVLLVVLLLPAYYTGFRGWSEAGTYFYFLQNFDRPHPGFFSEAWSISIEEWFYLMAPIIIYFLIVVMRLSVRSSILSTAIVMIIFSISYRYYQYDHILRHSGRDWDDLFRKVVLARLDSIMVGVLGALAWRFHYDWWVRYKLPLLLIGIITLLCMKVVIEIWTGLKFIIFVPYFTINALGTLCLIPYLSELKTGKGRLYQIITYISIISYSMYLLNLSLVQGYLLRKIDFYDYSSFFFLSMRYTLYWVFTVLGAAILYKYVERPFMDMRKKLG